MKVSIKILSLCVAFAMAMSILSFSVLAVDDYAALQGKTGIGNTLSVETNLDPAIYQWFRSDGEIPWESFGHPGGSTYELTEADLGYFFIVNVYDDSNPPDSHSNLVQTNVLGPVGFGLMGEAVVGVTIAVNDNVANPLYNFFRRLPDGGWEGPVQSGESNEYILQAGDVGYIFLVNVHDQDELDPVGGFPVLVGQTNELGPVQAPVVLPDEVSSDWVPVVGNWEQNVNDVVGSDDVGSNVVQAVTSDTITGDFTFSANFEVVPDDNTQYSYFFVLRDNGGVTSVNPETGIITIPEGAIGLRFFHAQQRVAFFTGNSGNNIARYSAVDVPALGYPVVVDGKVEFSISIEDNKVVSFILNGEVIDSVQQADTSASPPWGSVIAIEDLVLPSAVDGKVTAGRWANATTEPVLTLYDEILAEDSSSSEESSSQESSSEEASSSEEVSSEETSTSLADDETDAAGDSNTVIYLAIMILISGALILVQKRRQTNS